MLDRDFIFYQLHNRFCNEKTITTALLVAALGANAQSDIITLDLTKAESKLEFDAKTGAWTGTFDDDEVTIDSQNFCFLHNSMGEWMTWWGFTMSNSADNSFRDNFTTYQFSNMAEGGIVLNDDGTVKTNQWGAPVTSADVPYIVGYGNGMFAAHPAEMLMSDGLDHEAVGMYVCLNSYAFYSILQGDASSRAFTEGDRFTLTVHGENSNGDETSLDVTLASFTNGDLTAARGWKYVDLSSLGSINYLWFSMKSTDSGTYGDNTPSYFCIDKLMVKAEPSLGVDNIAAESRAKISYDRDSQTVTLSNADFAMVFDVTGNRVMSSHEPVFSTASLPHGVYLIKAGNSTLKIVR